MDTSGQRSTTDRWSWLLVAVLCTTAGAVAGVAALGSWPRQTTVGLVVAALATIACAVPLLRSRREVRHLRALGAAHDRFAELAGRVSPEEALAGAVEVLAPHGQLVALHLGAPPPAVADLAAILVTDALRTGRVAVLPDGTSGQETARLVALPIAVGGRRVGAAVLRMAQGSDDGLAEVQHLLGRIGPALTAPARTGPPPPAPVDAADEDAPAPSDDHLRQLVARGSHDLRTPLNTLAGMAETLARHGEALEPSAREELYGALQRSTRRVAGWITVLLDAAVADQPRTTRPVPTALQPLLEEAVTVTHAATAGLEVELVPTELYVRADPGELVRTVSNLLANAGHHAGDGTRVVVEARPRGARVEVAVRDHGVGWGAPTMSPNAADGDRRHLSGHGLGLESVRAQVASWGGELELGDTPGGGATIRFTLPRARPDEDAVDQEQQWTIAGRESHVRGLHRTQMTSSTPPAHPTRRTRHG